MFQQPVRVFGRRREGVLQVVYDARRAGIGNALEGRHGSERRLVSQQHVLRLVAIDEGLEQVGLGVVERDRHPVDIGVAFANLVVEYGELVGQSAATAVDGVEQLERAHHARIPRPLDGTPEAVLPACVV